MNLAAVALTLIHFSSCNCNSSLIPLTLTSLDFKRYGWRCSIEGRLEALLRGRAPLLSHRFPSWPSISRASSMSTSQPCSTQTGYQREARKESPYFPDFRFFLQTTYFCIGETAMMGDMGVGVCVRRVGEGGTVRWDWGACIII